MFSIVSRNSILLSCRNYILREKSGEIVSPSQIDSDWISNIKDIEFGGNFFTNQVARQYLGTNDELIHIRALVPELSLLIPGVGTQGGNLYNSVKFGNQSGAALINISRGICFAGDLSERDIRNTAGEYVQKMNEVFHEKRKNN